MDWLSKGLIQTRKIGVPIGLIPACCGSDLVDLAEVIKNIAAKSVLTFLNNTKDGEVNSTPILPLLGDYDKVN